jgi:hypothetical protein
MVLGDKAVALGRPLVQPREVEVERQPEVEAAREGAVALVGDKPAQQQRTAPMGPMTARRRLSSAAVDAGAERP